MDTGKDRLEHPLTPAEAAEILAVSPVTLRRWAQQGLLKADLTLGGHRRFRRNELVRFAREQGLTLHWPKHARLRVLVVDDDRQVVRFLEELLQGLSHPPEVAVAHDGFEAGIQVMAFRPDVLLLDLMMPGMDGFSVCEFIKGDPQTRTIRVIAITGYRTPENVERIRKAGAELCLAKPFDIDDLLFALGISDTGELLEGTLYD